LKLFQIDVEGCEKRVLINSSHFTITDVSSTCQENPRTQGGELKPIKQIPLFVSFSLYCSFGLFAGISLPARISAKFAGGAMNYHSENGDELSIFLIAGRRTVKPIGRKNGPFRERR
jgi:hypothetical protein